MSFKYFSPLLLITAISTPSFADAGKQPLNVESLKKQLDALSKKVKELENKEPVVCCESAPVVAKSRWPQGYIDLPGIDTGLKFNATIKADFSYDFNSRGGQGILDATSIPLKGVDAAASKSGHFLGTVRASSFGFDSITQLNGEEVKGCLKFDFARMDGEKTSYQPRILFGYFEWRNFLFGQTTSLFDHAAAQGTTLDIDGLNLSSPRVPQVRYTFNINPSVKLMVAAQKANTDYTINAKDSNSNDTMSQKDNSNFGKSYMPDLATQLKYEGKWGEVALRGILRSLQVEINDKDKEDNTLSAKRTGWGVGLSTKINTIGNSNVFGLINYGKGLGSGIDDADGYAAYVDVRTKNKTIMELITVTQFGLGYEHWWTPKFRTSVMGAYTKFTYPSKVTSGDNAANENTLNSSFRRFVVNFIYSPIPNVDLGLEVLHHQRKTIGGKDSLNKAYSGKEGKATRVMTSFVYRFNA